jgi:hypothetical protein
MQRTVVYAKRVRIGRILGENGGITAKKKMHLQKYHKNITSFSPYLSGKKIGKCAGVLLSRT